MGKEEEAWIEERRERALSGCWCGGREGGKEGGREGGV